MRSDQLALSPLARARGRDHQYSHYSSLPVIISPRPRDGLLSEARRRAYAELSQL
jgi:hypothetical protein